MNSFYQFASESPWLTFFLFMIVCGTIAKVARALSPWKKQTVVEVESDEGTVRRVRQK